MQRKPYAPRKRRPLADRFWEKVDKHGPVPVHRPELGPCWLWTSSLQYNGYGKIGIHGRSPALAHRVSYELVNGPLPAGAHLDHVCHNGSGCTLGDSCPHRRCVNPAHLEPASARENVRRGESQAAHQARQTHCVHGHEFTPENTRWHKGHRNCRACEKREDRERTARRRAAAGPRTCGVCGKPLPADSHGKRRYCEGACTLAAIRAAERRRRQTPSR